MAEMSWNGQRPDKQSPIPLYYQVVERIEARIASGELRPGDRLPSERDLAAQAGISRMTARQAIAYLVERDAIEVRHGIGAFVAQPKLTSDPLHLLGFTEQMMATGGAVSSQVLNQEVVPAPAAVASALRLEPDAGIVRILRLRSLDGSPVLLEASYFPRALVAGLEREDLASCSLYALLEHAYGLRLTHAQQTVEAIAANAYEAGLFGIDKGSPMLLLQGVALTREGVAGEFFRAVYRGDRFKFALRAAEAEAAATGPALPIDLVMT